MALDYNSRSNPDYHSDYPSGYNYGNLYGPTYRRLNGLEIIVIILGILVLVGVFVLGLMQTNAINRDQQRRSDISQVQNALDNFYLNTSNIPSRRFYPVAICSGDLNEVDFESTLRNFLTGQKPEVDPHVYIKPENFPKDRWGVYSSTFVERKVPFRCPNILPAGSTGYPDNTPSCNFSPTRRIRQCYIYTSSNNGDTYQIGYWSEAQNKFVIYKRFRQEAIQVITQ